MISEREAKIINESLTVKEAIRTMLKNDLREVIVVDNKNNYKGVVKLRDLISEKNYNEKIKKVKKRDCKVYEKDEKEIAKAMLQNDCYLAAYLDKNDKVIGSFHINDLLEFVKENFGTLKVEEVETKNPIIIEASEPIYKAIKLMATYNISHIPIIKERKLYGIVSSKDISEFILKYTKERVSLGELIGKKFEIFKNPVESISTKKVITYEKNEKNSNVIKKMFYHKISCLVKEDLSGIITKKDLIKPILIKEKEEFEIIIVGKENVPSYYQSYLENYAKRFVSKVKKSITSGFLKIVVEKHKDIYSIHITFSDYKNFFRVYRERREFLDTLQECFDSLEIQIYDKFLGRSKRIATKILEYLKEF